MQIRPAFCEKKNFHLDLAGLQWNLKMYIFKIFKKMKASYSTPIH